MKKILICGATSTIAVACAKIWAVEKAEFFLVARNADKLQQTADDLIVRGATKVHQLVADLNQFDRHQEIINNTFSDLKTVDIALIAHGTLPDQNACEQNVDLALKEFSSNGLSVISLLTLLAGKMANQKSGTIAVISSVAGDRGRGSNYLYGSAKAAVTTFCEGLRAKLFQSNVNVLTIKPGFVDTAMTKDLQLPKLLLATPEKVANDIIKAIQKNKNSIYTPWFWWGIMLIIKCIPTAIFKKLKL
jgi:decaprenylphospho-beta-D-erythro-pentofuranosid-2-ulose 2-reductase